MKRYVKLYETGATRKEHKFFWLPTRVNGTLVWGWRWVNQRMIIAYKRRGAGDFGEIAPTPIRVWEDVHIIH